MSPAILLQEGGSLPGPKSGILPITREWIVWGDTCADKARDFIRKGSLGREQQGKGTPENCSAMWLAVSGFMGMGLVSGLSLANHFDSGSFLVARSSLSQDGFQREGFWEVGRTYGLTSPLFFWPFPNSSSWWWLVSSAFLTGTSCCKITHASDDHHPWPGRVVLVSGSPNSISKQRMFWPSNHQPLQPPPMVHPQGNSGWK